MLPLIAKLIALSCLKSQTSGKRSVLKAEILVLLVVGIMHSTHVQLHAAVSLLDSTALI